MVRFLSSGVVETPLQQFLLSSLYLFHSILSSIVWIDKLHNCVEGTSFRVSQGNRKKTLFMVAVANRKKNAS